MARPRSKRPTLRDVVKRRHQRADLTEILRYGRDPRKQVGRNGRTVTVSFTLTPEQDLVIDDLARRQGLTRSAVIRQAVLWYGWQHESPVLKDALKETPDEA